MSPFRLPALIALAGKAGDHPAVLILPLAAATALAILLIAVKGGGRSGRRTEARPKVAGTGRHRYAHRGGQPIRRLAA